MLFRHVDSNQKKALEELYELFQLDISRLHAVMVHLRAEIDAGLEDDRLVDLNMIPTFVTGYPTGQEKGTYLALEVAGMDIYCCQVKLEGNSGKLTINQYQYKITQDLTSGDDFTVLVDYIVECISDFLVRFGTQPDHIYSMAVSFGFATKQMGLNSGKIMSLGHGFNYPTGVGVDIVQVLTERINVKGLPIKIVAIANDSVCTLLAHAYQHPGTRLGVVHCWGTNCSYYESARNIVKLQHKSDQDMIINTEWGNFGSSRRTLPCTWFDRKLDRESINPQYHVFEKMTTSNFLGELVRNVLIYLIDRDLLFNGESCEAFNRPYTFDTSYMYVIEADMSSDLKDTRTVLEDMMGITKTSMADREIVKNVCELIGHRAAGLVGAALAAIVQHMVIDGVGGLDQEGYTIAISGSIYEDYPSFHPHVCKTLKDLILPDIASKLSVGIVKHNRIVGAAIVAMMAEKIAAEP